MNLFSEISRTNAAYCAAHGLSGAELYGTPPNRSEIEVHDLIAAGVPAESAPGRLTVPDEHERGGVMTVLGHGSEPARGGQRPDSQSRG